MYCTRCGTQNADGSRFCTACGASTEPDGSAYGAGSTASSWASAPPRRLRRIMSEKKIGGVCAGFAEYFEMDVTLVRLIWVALVLIPPFPAVIAYIIAWIVLPRA